MPTTFVIIVTYNGENWIRLALDSLRDSQLKCSIVVVDNASTDTTNQIISSEYPEVKLLPQSRNTGFGVGNNIGISFAIQEKAEFVFLLNQDAYVTPTAIGQLVSFLQKLPSYSIVSPLHCSPDLQSVDPQTQKRYLQSNAPQYLSDACLNRVREHYDILGINAAAWLIRVSVFRKVGGFDPLFFMYGEDDDLINRFAYFGEKFALYPASKIVHLRAKNVRKSLGFWSELWSNSERARSALLLDVKAPSGNIFGKLLRLTIEGIAYPLIQAPLHRDWRELAARLLACVRVLSEFPVVLKASERCKKSASHYLEI
jgi:GT2 family glycosyltransferase